MKQKKMPSFLIASLESCGEKGIRTLGTRKRSTVFETAPFDHSGISPKPFIKQKQPFRVAFSAETEGFEPPIHFCITVFKTAAIDRSAISPLQKYKSFQCNKLFFKNFLIFSEKSPIFVSDYEVI